MMKKNVLEYKGYHTTIEFDAETFILRGKIEGINDLVNFESNDPKNIEQEFHTAVDDYLAFCQEVGKEPDKERPERIMAESKIFPVKSYTSPAIKMSYQETRSS